MFISNVYVSYINIIYLLFFYIFAFWTKLTIERLVFSSKRLFRIRLLMVGNHFIRVWFSYILWLDVLPEVYRGFKQGSLKQHS